VISFVCDFIVIFGVCSIAHYIYILYLYLCSYPLCFIGARDGLLDLFKIPQAKRDESLQNKLTVGLIAVITAMAAKLTDLGLVASVGGATFGTALVFVYPTIMLIKVKKNKGIETKIAAVIAAIGVVMGAIGTVLSFTE